MNNNNIGQQIYFQKKEFSPNVLDNQENMTNGHYDNYPHCSLLKEKKLVYYISNKIFEFIGFKPQDCRLLDTMEIEEIFNILKGKKKVKNYMIPIITNNEVLINSNSLNETISMEESNSNNNINTNDNKIKDSSPGTTTHNSINNNRSGTPPPLINNNNIHNLVNIEDIVNMNICKNKKKKTSKVGKDNDKINDNANANDIANDNDNDNTDSNDYTQSKTLQIFKKTFIDCEVDPATPIYLDRLLSKTEYSNFLKVLHVCRYITYRCILRQFVYVKIPLELTTIVLNNGEKMYDDHSKSLSLENLSKKFSVTRWHLHRVFKSFTGITIKDFENIINLTICSNHHNQNVLKNYIMENKMFQDYNIFYIKFNDNDYWNDTNYLPPKNNSSTPNNITLEGYYIECVNDNPTKDLTIPNYSTSAYNINNSTFSSNQYLLQRLANFTLNDMNQYIAQYVPPQNQRNEEDVYMELEDFKKMLAKHKNSGNGNPASSASSSSSSSLSSSLLGSTKLNRVGKKTTKKKPQKSNKSSLSPKEENSTGNIAAISPVSLKEKTSSSQLLQAHDIVSNNNAGSSSNASSNDTFLTPPESTVPNTNNGMAATAQQYQLYNPAVQQQQQQQQQQETSGNPTDQRKSSFNQVVHDLYNADSSLFKTLEKQYFSQNQSMFTPGTSDPSQPEQQSQSRQGSLLQVPQPKSASHLQVPQPESAANLGGYFFQQHGNGYNGTNGVAGSGGFPSVFTPSFLTPGVAMGLGSNDGRSVSNLFGLNAQGATGNTPLGFSLTPSGSSFFARNLASPGFPIFSQSPNPIGSSNLNPSNNTTSNTNTSSHLSNVISASQSNGTPGSFNEKNSMISETIPNATSVSSATTINNSAPTLTGFDGGLSGMKLLRNDTPVQFFSSALADNGTSSLPPHMAQTSANGMGATSNVPGLETPGILNVPTPLLNPFNSLNSPFPMGIATPTIQALRKEQPSRAGSDLPIEFFH